MERLAGSGREITMDTIRVKKLKDNAILPAYGSAEAAGGIYMPV